MFIPQFDPNIIFEKYKLSFFNNESLVLNNQENLSVLQFHPNLISSVVEESRLYHTIVNTPKFHQLLIDLRRYLSPFNPSLDLNTLLLSFLSHVHKQQHLRPNELYESLIQHSNQKSGTFFEVQTDDFYIHDASNVDVHLPKGTRGKLSHYIPKGSSDIHVWLNNQPKLIWAERAANIDFTPTLPIFDLGLEVLSVQNYFNDGDVISFDLYHQGLVILTYKLKNSVELVDRNMIIHKLIPFVAMYVEHLNKTPHYLAHTLLDYLLNGLHGVIPFSEYIESLDN
ncbi:hypothetical protein [Acinetobacter sp. P1(2025)]|uniref:hypothetical protein n=1 Tax=Acinetobacter sp. P1(2025) TaxID=3446120 RepID=UPI003F530238